MTFVEQVVQACQKVQSIATVLLFERYPARLIVEMVYICGFWLSSFPHRDGVHTAISPRAIMKGLKHKYDKHFKIEFVTYVQVHKNTTTPWNPGHWYFSLKTIWKSIGQTLVPEPTHCKQNKEKQLDGFAHDK